VRRPIAREATSSGDRVAVVVIVAESSSSVAVSRGGAADSGHELLRLGRGTHTVDRGVGKTGSCGTFERARLSSGVQPCKSTLAPRVAALSCAARSCWLRSSSIRCNCSAATRFGRLGTRPNIGRWLTHPRSAVSPCVGRRDRRPSARPSMHRNATPYYSSNIYRCSDTSVSLPQGRTTPFDGPISARSHPARPGRRACRFTSRWGWTDIIQRDIISRSLVRVHGRPWRHRRKPNASDRYRAPVLLLQYSEELCCYRAEQVWRLLQQKLACNKHRSVEACVMNNNAVNAIYIYIYIYIVTGELFMSDKIIHDEQWTAFIVCTQSK